MVELQQFSFFKNMEMIDPKIMIQPPIQIQITKGFIKTSNWTL